MWGLAHGSPGRLTRIRYQQPLKTNVAKYRLNPKNVRTNACAGSLERSPQNECKNLTLKNDRRL